MTTELNKWTVESEPDLEEYLVIKHQHFQGFIQIKAEAEGYVIDVFSEDAQECVATMCVMGSDLEIEE